MSRKLLTRAETAAVANDLARLQTENEQLRAALEEIVFAVELDDARRTAGVALNQQIRND
jgi:hypothetical protein